MSELLKHAPDFTLEEASELCRKLYGLNCTAGLLQSERDQNFKLTDGSGKEYVLKISNALEYYSLLDMQNRAMQYLNHSLYDNVCPDPVESTEKKLICTVTDNSGNQHFVRLLNFISGQFVSEIGLLSDDGEHKIRKKFLTLRIILHTKSILLEGRSTNAWKS